VELAHFIGVSDAKLKVIS